MDIKAVPSLPPWWFWRKKSIEIIRVRMFRQIWFSFPDPKLVSRRDKVFSQALITAISSFSIQLRCALAGTFNNMKVNSIVFVFYQWRFIPCLHWKFPKRISIIFPGGDICVPFQLHRINRKNYSRKFPSMEIGFKGGSRTGMKLRTSC